MEPAPDPFLKVTTMSTRRNHSPISEKGLTGLCACPRGHPLPAEPTGAAFRVVEDILDGRLVAIQYAVVRRHCRKCRRQVAAEISGILPGGWFGAGLACLETVMRMHGIPYETIRRLINIIYHTDLAKSTVISHVDGVTGSLHPPYERMPEGMLFSEYIGDKTSRKIAGILYWLWVMVGAASTVFHMDRSRGGDVLAMLPGGYGGHVTSDSHPAWNRIGRTRQKCHYHHVREIVRTLAMKNPGPEFKRFARILRRTVRDSWFPARGLDPNGGRTGRNRKVRNLQAKVRRLISGRYADPHCRRFVKRLRREITHLFTFIRLGGKCHNNGAGRPLRPSVTSRKVSGGSKSHAGAYNHAVLAAIRETCRRRGVNPYDFMVGYMYGRASDIPSAAAAA